ncbi:NAD-dependent epimerase/dehydratase family protein [Halobaculum sp. MBLA0147]|uniref:NAD-dependent epimerase/dehydratase family protein n=1 Tax=Halobaculum sp. MBLA0147 TaxID=3079934 RepID=UPI003524FB94
MDNITLSDVCVRPDTSLRESMQTIDKSGLGIVFITDADGELRGTATDGDIRRGILSGQSLSTAVSEVATADPIAIQADWDDTDLSEKVSIQQIEQKTDEFGTLTVPVLDGDEVVDITFLDENASRIDSSASGMNQTSVDTVLVIGGAGYIGSVLCEKLLSQGYNVRVLDNLLYEDTGIEQFFGDDRFTFIEGDMRSIEDLVDAMNGADAAVHLGALVGDPASSIDPQETLEVNYHATALAARIAKYHQINRFLFASTCSVYGQADDPETLLTEESPLNPVSLYAKSKIQSERALTELSDENFSPTILRMATVYGLSPRMRFDLVVNILSAKAQTEGTIPIFGGKQYRPNVHVADAAQAYIDCIEAPIEDVSGEVFNVGSNEQNYQIEEIGYIISERYPDAEIDFDREQEDERSYQVDFSKIERVLGYETEHTIGESSEAIGEAIADDRFDDYTSDRYSNYRTLEDTI